MTCYQGLEKVDPVEEKVARIKTASEVLEEQKKKKEEKFIEEYLKVLDIFDREIRTEYKGGNRPICNGSTVKISPSITTDNKVFEKATQTLNEKGWKVRRLKDADSDHARFMIKPTEGDKVVPTKEPRKTHWVEWVVFFGIVVTLVTQCPAQ